MSLPNCNYWVVTGCPKAEMPGPTNYCGSVDSGNTNCVYPATNPPTVVTEATSALLQCPAGNFDTMPLTWIQQSDGSWTGSKCASTP